MSIVKTNESDDLQAALTTRWRPWIRTAVLVSLVVLVAFTILQITRRGSPIPSNTPLTAISPSDFADSSLPRTVRVRNVTFTLERACRGYSDDKTGPTNTKPFTVAKTPWAVGYHAVRRSRETSPWMFAAGVVGEKSGKEARQPIVSFYEPGSEGTSAGDAGTKDVVMVHGICGNCLISVYAINCDWEVGVYGWEIDRDKPVAPQNMLFAPSNRCANTERNDNTGRGS